MKKTFYIILLFFLNISFLTGKVTFKTLIGYGFNLKAQTKLGDQSLTQKEYEYKEGYITERLVREKNLYYNPAEGMKFIFGADIDIHKNISSGLEIMMSDGREANVYKKIVYTEWNGESYDDNMHEELWQDTVISTSYILLGIPIKLKTTISKFVPFISIGPTIAIYAKSDVRSLDFENGKDLETEEEYNFNNNIGMQSTIGVDYEISDHFILSTVLRGDILSLKVKSKKYTKYMDQGQDNVNKLDTYDKETEYVDEIDYKEPIDRNSPRKQQAFTIPLSSLSFFIGIKYRI